MFCKVSFSSASWEICWLIGTSSKKCACKLHLYLQHRFTKYLELPEKVLNNFRHDLTSKPNNNSKLEYRCVGFAIYQLFSGSRKYYIKFSFPKIISSSFENCESRLIIIFYTRVNPFIHDRTTLSWDLVLHLWFIYVTSVFIPLNKSVNGFNLKKWKDFFGTCKTLTGRSIYFF